MTNIHPSAIIDKDVQLDTDIEIGPYCCIGSKVRIGSGTRLESHVVIEPGIVIGKHNTFGAHCVIGGLPQILGYQDGDNTGGVVIGDHNVFREYITIHRSIHAGKATILGNHNLLMVGSHIGHDCQVADQVVLTNTVQIGGHCILEDGAWLSGLAAMHQFVTFGQWAYSAGLTTIIRDVPPFVMISGSYPTKVRGVNRRGLKRAGFTDEQQRSICDAFHKLFRGKGTLLENAKALSREGPLNDHVRAMVESIERRSQQRFGRYREKFRS